MRYANPFKFYLSASIIFFILWGFGKSYDNIEPFVDDNEIEALAQDSIAQQFVNQANPGKTIKLDSLITNQKLKAERSYREINISDRGLDTMSFMDATEVKFDIYSRFYKETDIKSAEIAMDSLSYPQTAYNHWLYKKATDWNSIEENPGLFLNYFINKLPFIIFFYLPIFALFIWLLYIRRPFNYMEHLVFTFHVQTTFFILLSLGLLLGYIIPGNWIMKLCNVIFAFYLYKALRGFYGQGRAKTIAKFILLNFIFFMMAGVAAITSILASFAIY